MTPNFKKPFLSALFFFGTVLALSVGYAAWNSGMAKVNASDTLRAANWNAIVDNINDLDSRWARNGAAIAYTGGYVGIGTASPPRLFTVSGNGLGNSAIEISDTSQGANLKNFMIDNRNQTLGFGTDSDAGNNFGYLMAITRSGSVGIGTTNPGQFGGTNFTINDPSQTVIGLQVSNANSMRLVSDASNSYVWEARNASLLFGTSNAEQMRIAANGNVGIGTTSPTLGKMQITSPNTASDYVGIYVTQSDPQNWGIFTTGSNYGIRAQGTVYSAYFNGPGYIDQSAWLYASDRRLKENISYFDTGLDTVMQLKPAAFDYISGSKNNLGFIAQDVQEVIPEAVSVTNPETGMLGLKTDFIIPYLVNAIKELKTKNDSLERENQEIRSRLDTLERR